MRQIVQDNAVTGDTFIQAMRTVAHSVTVVTTNGPAGRHGATVSAFCSVTADPPTVLVCLNAKSKIAELVAANKCFTVNILPERSQDIARRFAGLDDETIKDRFENIELSNQRVPEIAGASVFACHLTELIPSGTHIIALGQVMRVEKGKHPPLTYHDGAYRKLMNTTEQA